MWNNYLWLLTYKKWWVSHCLSWAMDDYVFFFFFAPKSWWFIMTYNPWRIWLNPEVDVFVKFLLSIWVCTYVIMQLIPWKLFRISFSVGLLAWSFHHILCFFAFFRGRKRDWIRFRQFSFVCATSIPLLSLSFSYATKWRPTSKLHAWSQKSISLSRWLFIFIILIIYFFCGRDD